MENDGVQCAKTVPVRNVSFIPRLRRPCDMHGTLIKAFGTVSQWVSASQIAFNIIISPTHTPCKIVESRRDL